MRANSELLAPAGSISALNAAVRGGANAVYLGLSEFNARRNADNFTLENLPEAVEYCHLHGVKVYVAMNTIVITNELDRWVKLADACKNAGADALIIQDFGLAKIVSEAYGSGFVHLSTQMNIHNCAGIDFAHTLGAGRVTLARELSLAEISQICEYAHSLNIEVETFVHGAICVCYSGQCLFSSLVGGRSANRGTCAQACRLPYKLICNSQEVQTASKLGNYLLSPKDMCAIDKIPDLIDAGVDSFKIEGRMKSPEYVYSAVCAYNEKMSAPHTPVSPKAKLSLESTFSRGFTSEYLDGKCDNNMMSYSRPNNRGVFVGRVDKIDVLANANKPPKTGKGFKNNNIASGMTRISFKSEIDLQSGDILEIWTKKGRSTFTMPENFGLKSNGKYEVSLNDILRGVNKSDRIFRVRSASDVFTFDMNEPKIDIDVEIDMHIDRPISMQVTSGENAVYLEGPVLEKARTKTITSDDVFEHFNRLGNSPFCVCDFKCRLDDGAGIGFSAIHKLRQNALEELKNAIVLGNSCKIKSSSTVTEISERITSASSKVVKKNFLPEICVLATNPMIARLARRLNVNKVYVPEINFKRGNAVLAGKTLTETPQMGYPKDIAIMKSLVNRNLNSAVDEMISYDCLYVEDYGSLAGALEADVEFEIGQMLPITNRISGNIASAFSPDCIWLSPELNLAQIKDVAKNISSEVGIFAYGRQRIMTCEHCALKASGPCDQNCCDCARRRQEFLLRDEKGYEFPVITSASGISTIYNSVALDVFADFADLISAGVTKFMIDTSLMDENEAYNAIQYATSSIKKPPKQRKKNHTSGHLHRGVK